MGSGRFGEGFQTACDVRGTRSRSPFPSARRCLAEAPRPATPAGLDFSWLFDMCSVAELAKRNRAGEDCPLRGSEASSAPLGRGEFQAARRKGVLESREPGQPVMKNYEKATWIVLLTLLFASLGAVIFTHSWTDYRERLRAMRQASKTAANTVDTHALDTTQQLAPLAITHTEH